jgi:hypothetical protein
VGVYGENFDTPPGSRPVIEFGEGNVYLEYMGGSSTGCRVVVPPGPPGPVDVFISNRDGTCILPSGYEYLPPDPCTVSWITPIQGPEAGGNIIRIVGSHFPPVGLGVFIGSTPTDWVDFVSDSEIRAPVPPGIGRADVTVDLWGWTQCTLPGAYRYLPCAGPACQITKVDPDPAAVGELVTIQGNGFESGSQVYFGGAEANVIDETGLPRRLVVEVPIPPGSSNTVDVTIIHAGGVCCTRPGAFTYLGCDIFSLSRDNGIHLGGTPVAIFGRGFSVSPPPRVWFGHEESALVIPDTPGQFFVVAPPADGQETVDIIVMNPDGEVCTCPGCFRYNLNCEITSIVPDTTTTNGSVPVTITGRGFDPIAVKVRFDQVYASIFGVTVDPGGTWMTLTVPPAYTPGPRDVRIINESLLTRCTLVDGFTYTLPGGGPCAIAALVPPGGDVSGGDTVLIQGSGFSPNTGVLIGDAPCPSVTYLSSSEIEIVTPPNVAQAPCLGCGVPMIHDVVVAPANRDPCILEKAFTYVDPQPPPMPCDVTAVVPDNGSVAGGNQVTVVGSGFSSNNPRVLFGPDLVPAVHVDEFTLIAVVPPSSVGAGVVDVAYGDDDGCGTICTACYTYN